MTIQEIRDLIAKKIAGQGTQVDVGGGLVAILNAICDKLATIPSPYTLPAATAEALGGVKIGSGLQVAADGTASLSEPVGVSADISNATLTEVASGLHLSESIISSILNGDIAKVRMDSKDCLIFVSTSGEYIYATFYTWDNTNESIYPAFTLSKNVATNLYTFSEV